MTAEAGLGGTAVAAVGVEQLVWGKGRAVVQEHAVVDLELSFAPLLLPNSSSSGSLLGEPY